MTFSICWRPTPTLQIGGCSRPSATMGLEPLRNWLSPKWLQAGAASSRSNHSPTRRRLLSRLRGRVSKGLLFGNSRLQELTRRPFFMAVLARLSAPAGIATEVDLADAWWNAGGYNALPDRVGHRQRALVQLAQQGGRTLGRSMSPSRRAIQARSRSSATMASLGKLVPATRSDSATIFISNGRSYTC